MSLCTFQYLNISRSSTIGREDIQHQNIFAHLNMTNRSKTLTLDRV